MASIYIRDVDQEFYWKLKDAAQGARKSFKQHILDVLATSIAAEVPEPAVNPKILLDLDDKLLKIRQRTK